MKKRMWKVYGKRNAAEKISTAPNCTSLPRQKMKQ